jgi:hypothetical protein
MDFIASCIEDSRRQDAEFVLGNAEIQSPRSLCQSQWEQLLARYYFGDALIKRVLYHSLFLQVGLPVEEVRLIVSAPADSSTHGAVASLIGQSPPGVPSVGIWEFTK